MEFVVRMNFAVKFFAGSFNSEQITLCSRIKPGFVGFKRLFAQRKRKAEFGICSLFYFENEFCNSVCEFITLLLT